VERVLEAEMDGVLERWRLGAGGAAPPCLLIEVPHGADQRAHFDALAGRLRGPFPADLHAFFHVNTDVGAVEVGFAVAAGLVARDPRRSVGLLRCLLPRTFIDCNRALEQPAGDLQRGGLTAAMAPYVRDADDQALLHALHTAYVGAVHAEVDAVCAAGGLVLIPHTYAPRTVGISAVDDDIVERLRECWAPDQVERWPLRPPVDLIVETPSGEDLSPPGAAAALVQAYATLGVEAVRGGTYTLHPATMAYQSARRWPGQTLCLELRRDLLMKSWAPFSPMEADPAQVERLAQPLVDVLDARLRAAGR
jgi:hypothetical protein